jgi:diguanylate cyclase (GGDEF)-like protein/PAS domain S-box-containing protein
VSVPGATQGPSGPAREGGEPSDPSRHDAPELVLLRWALDALLDPLVTLRVRRDGEGAIDDFEIVGANAEACAYFRLDRSVLVGTRLLELLPGPTGQVLLGQLGLAVESGELLDRSAMQLVSNANVDRVIDLRAVAVGDQLSLTWREVTDRMATEARLRDSEARYRFLVENASDVVFRSNPDSTIEWVSPSVEQLIGLSPDEVIGSSVFDLVAVDDVEDLAAVVDQVLGGEPARFRGRVIAADGPRWVAVTAKPTFDESGEVTGSVGSVRDVHSEVIAEHDLAASEQRLSLVADNASDLVCLSGSDRCISWISANVERTLGWAAADLIGTKLADLIHPDDVAANDSRRQGFYDTETPNPIEQVLLRVRAKDGAYHWMAATGMPVVDSGGLVSVVTGMRLVDDLVEARDRAEREHSRASAALDTFLDPHVVMEAVRDEGGAIVDFVYVEANETAVAYNQPLDPVGARLLEHFPGHTAAGLFAAYCAVVESGEPLVLDEFEYLNEIHGKELYYDIRAVKLGDAISLTWRDVSDRYDRMRLITERATHDALTGLVNRTGILEELDRALNTSARSGRPTGVLLVDLDHFKYVNDSLGHAVGDRVLCSAADRLRSSVRGGDLVGRLGGDEFVVVMRDLDDEADAVATAQRLVSAFRDPLSSEGLEFYATASVGIAISGDGTTPDDLVREADTALYRAKDEGRDRASVFNEDLRERATRRITLEAELRPALANGELEVFYQPEVDLTTGRVIAVEALVRWHHPSGELYAADRFIETAEETGLILDIGDWVLEVACRQAARWADDRPDRPITVRVNVSALQLAERGLVDAIDVALSGSGLDPSLLCIEITETALLNETSIARANLGAIRDRGVHIALDDFGTGYASLAYLRDFPIHIIKIDRGFTVNLLSDDYERRLVAGIIALAELLEMRVTAEGIEEPEQALLLAELGCNSGQGFLFARAIPAADVEALFDRTFPVG